MCILLDAGNTETDEIGEIEQWRRKLNLTHQNLLFTNDFCLNNKISDFY